MFAGIIEKLGAVAAVRSATQAGADVRRLEVDALNLFDELRLGASVAVNGVCLTLAEKRGSIGGFDVIPETWRGTALRLLQPGDLVNLERSLRVGDRIDGHFVQGHVDTTGTVERIDRGDGQYKFWVQPDSELAPYLVRKGSVALDGVSLTIKEGVCTVARVGLGAVAPTALLVEPAAKALIGSKLDDAAIAKAAEACRAACRPIDDKRGTVAYRIKTAGVLLKRTLAIAAKRATEK